MGHRDDVYWANFFGIAPEAWAGTGALFRPHAALSGYRGLWCFRREQRVIVSAPPAWLDALAARWKGWTLARLLDPAEVEQSLGADCERCIGPAFQGAVDASQLRGVAVPQARPASAADEPAIDRLRQRCGPEEWSTSSVDQATEFRTIHTDDSEVTAVAGLRDKGNGVGDICVLTDPGHRGKGRGAAVVRAATAAALAEGTLVLYQTLESNVGSVALALSVGFERYANHVAVRLARERP